MPDMNEVLAARRAARAARSQGRLNVVAVSIFLLALVVGLVMTAGSQNPGWPFVWVVTVPFLSQPPKIAKQGERAVGLRPGHYPALPGPRLFRNTPSLEQ